MSWCRMILRNSPYKGSANLDMAHELVQSGISFDPFDYRTDLLNVIEATKKVLQ